MNNTYIVTISLVPNGDEESSNVVYQQTVEALNIRGVIEAVNADAKIEILPAPRKRAPRSDKGKKRAAAGFTPQPFGQ